MKPERARASNATNEAPGTGISPSPETNRRRKLHAGAVDGVQEHVSTILARGGLWLMINRGTKLRLMAASVLARQASCNAAFPEDFGGKCKQVTTKESAADQVLAEMWPSCMDCTNYVPGAQALETSSVMILLRLQSLSRMELESSESLRTCVIEQIEEQIEMQSELRAGVSWAI